MDQIYQGYSSKGMSQEISINGFSFKKNEWEARRLKYNDDAPFLEDIYSLYIKCSDRKKYIYEKLNKIDIGDFKLEDGSDSSTAKRNILAIVNAIEEPKILNNVL